MANCLARCPAIDDGEVVGGKAGYVARCLCCAVTVDRVDRYVQTLAPASGGDVLLSRHIERDTERAQQNEYAQGGRAGQRHVNVVLVYRPVLGHFGDCLE